MIVLAFWTQLVGAFLKFWLGQRLTSELSAVFASPEFVLLALKLRKNLEFPASLRGEQSRGSNLVQSLIRLNKMRLLRFARNDEF